MEIETVVVNAANGNDYSMSDQLKKHLEGDVDISKLQHQFKTLSVFIENNKTTALSCVTSMHTIMDFMKTNNMAVIFRELDVLIKLYLTVPLSNASSERSFSTLRRIKSYLRSCLTQEHLYHYIMLHAHKDITDSIDLESVSKIFINANERRQRYFG